MKPPSFPEQFWVVGTDTNAGKTVVSALLVRHLKARYWKPVQTGTLTDSDERTVSELAGVPVHTMVPRVYGFREPLSPHAAAALECATIDASAIRFPEPDGVPLVAEAAGGLMVPLNDDVLQLDVIASSGRPVVLVAADRLGTINHTLLSLEALMQRAVPVAGVILCGAPGGSGLERDTAIHREAIERFGSVRVLAVVRPADSPASARLEFL